MDRKEYFGNFGNPTASTGSSGFGGSGSAAYNNNSNGSQAEDGSSRQLEERKEAVKIIQEMSSILNTGLDREELGLCIRICENGGNPQSLAQFIKSCRNQKAKMSVGNGTN